MAQKKAPAGKGKAAEKNAPPKSAPENKTAGVAKKKTESKPATKAPVKKKAAAKSAAGAAPNASAKKKAAPAANAPAKKKSPAQCIFDLYDLKFGMTKDTVAEVLDLSEEGHVNEEALLRAGAYLIQTFFDHNDRLWQVKAYYRIDNQAEAEALLDRMSKDYRFQTPTSRVAFEMEEEEDATFDMHIRYTEINLKRMFIHHQMAVGAARLAKIEEEEKRKRMIEELEDEDYIPTGPLMF